MYYSNATIEFSEGKRKLVFIEDLQDITFIVLSSPLNIHEKILLFLFYRWGNKPGLPRSILLTGLRCSTIWHQLCMTAKPVSFSAIFTSRGFCWKQQSGSFLVHLGFAISAAWLAKDTPNLKTYKSTWGLIDLDLSLNYPVDQIMLYPVSSFYFVASLKCFKTHIVPGNRKTVILY